MIPKPCIRCGASTDGSYCERCAGPVTRQRDARQPYRAGYTTPEYRRARRAAFARSGGQCEAILPDGTRCPQPALEAHHLTPLSSATTVEALLALNVEANLAAVCRAHNPRGGAVAQR